MRKNKKIRSCRIRVSALSLVLSMLILAFGGSMSVSAEEITASGEKVMVGGEIFGTRINTRGVLVVGVTGVISEKNERFPARDAGICSRDIINTVNGKEILNSEDLVSRIEKSEGGALEIGVVRDGKEMTVTLVPVISDSDGVYRGGLWVRDSLAGIGTVTFVDPESGEFVGLGHGICDPDTGVLMPVLKGGVFGVQIEGVKKSSDGDPGEIRGRLDSERVGNVISNTQSGIYGIFNDPPKGKELLLVAKREEIRTGDVKVICTLDDESGAKEYSAVIEKICDAEGKTKNFIIRITDDSLLAVTGGIVQGMSGSPIIQNGKLVGAVTHVLIDDPTKGYGIFAENMLENMAMPTEE